MSDTAKNCCADSGRFLSPSGVMRFGARLIAHIIEFPGGAVEISRTTDGDYWAHIIVNRTDFAAGDGDGLTSARGEVVDARIDREHPDGVVGIEKHERIEQIAVLIRSVKGGAR